MRRPGLPLPALELAVEQKQLLERARDHLQVSTARLAVLARQVVHADLGDARAARDQAREELGGEHRAAGLDLQADQDVAPEELERAVDVAHRDVQQGPDEPVPQVRVQLAHEVVLAIDAVADHDVGVLEGGQQVLDLADVELAVAVGEEGVVHRPRGEARPDGGAVAPVHLVPHHADARLARGDRRGALEGPVARAVVDHDDLEPLGDFG